MDRAGSRRASGGQAIAIGHPLPLTLDEFEACLPTLDAKGFVLWPVSAVVALRNQSR
jgi:polysaccharide deacetylase 2 family uncharacterized protein YibQ